MTAPVRISEFLLHRVRDATAWEGGLALLTNTLIADHVVTALPDIFDVLDPSSSHTTRRCRFPCSRKWPLLNWLQRFRTVVPDDSVWALKTETHDPLLDFEINSIEHELFARNAQATRWSPQQLTWRVGAARRAGPTGASPRFSAAVVATTQPHRRWHWRRFGKASTGALKRPAIAKAGSVK